MMERTTLVSYALDFASFLVNGELGSKINKIILFGSVARGDFSEKSDIDIFVDAPESLENDIEKTLTLFRSSQRYKLWKLKRVNNEISLKIGRLENWSLRREVISSGIWLYGKYSELPANLKYYLLIRMRLPQAKIARQVKIWRTLYGYTQKIGKKTYSNAGLLKKSRGMKLGKSTILIPMEQRKEILDFLKKNKVKCSVHELWSDAF